MSLQITFNDDSSSLLLLRHERLFATAFMSSLIFSMNDNFLSSQKTLKIVKKNIRHVFANN
jgi:hypothetical protein